MKVNLMYLPATALMGFFTLIGIFSLLASLVSQEYFLILFLFGLVITPLSALSTRHWIKNYLLSEEPRK